MKKTNATLTLIVIFMMASTLVGQSQQKKYSKHIMDMISKMSLKEKTEQLHGFGIGKDMFGDKGVIFFGTAGNEKVGIPKLIMGHGITGVRTGRDKTVNATYFCTPIAIGCTWDVGLYEKVGVAVAKEMRALGQNLNLGPTLNVIRHPLAGRTWECYSEDPFLIKSLIPPYVKSMQSNGIICGPKHFVANNQDDFRTNINNVIDIRTLNEIYFPGFKAAVQQGGALNIMSAYNRVNGTFMGEQKFLLDEVLRNQWGFKGFVLSDFGSGTRSTHGSIEAGMNVEMHSGVYYKEKLIKAVENKEIPMARIDELLAQKLYAMEQIGMFSENYISFPKEIVHSEEHQNIALEVARKSVVLLKNKDNILPLDATQSHKIAVIGPNAFRNPNYPINNKSEYAYYLQGGGSGRTYYFAKDVISLTKGIQNLVNDKAEVSSCLGVSLATTGFNAKKHRDYLKIDDKEFSKAIGIAKNADYVILSVGLNGFLESEGRDRKSYQLPENQRKLISEVSKLNKKVILVISSGSTVDITAYEPYCDAILYNPYAGEKVGQGAAEVIFGKKNPEGKLPLTWVKDIVSYPKGSIFTEGGYYKTKKSNIYKEGVFVGYRYFDKSPQAILYPFGFGLSYTNYKYSNIKTKKVGDNRYQILFTIKNRGKMDGVETVQLYIKDTNASVDRPIKELKGFRKVVLKEGESKQVSIEIQPEDFAFYNQDINKWTIEKGDFEILIGRSSQDIQLKTTIKVAETTHF